MARSCTVVISMQGQQTANTAKRYELSNSPSIYSGAWLASMLTVVVVGSALWVRPILAVDETRYLSVAWEMYQSGDWLVPQVHGQPYGHKPPMLFWLIQAAWSLCGVSEPAARCVAPIMGIAGLFVLARLANRIWPQEPSVASIAPLIVTAGLVWQIIGSMVMFDLPVTLFILLANLATWNLAQFHDRTPAWRNWLLLAFSTGCALLTKGPVIFVHIVPVAAMYSVWTNRWNWQSIFVWYSKFSSAMLAALLLLAAWAIPAAKQGGSEFVTEVLWTQYVGRLVQSFDHARPIWWYLPLLPAYLFPWGGIVWNGRRQLLQRPTDLGVRFCLIWTVSAFLIVSVVSGKQIHYLIPIVPAVALLLSRMSITLWQSAAADSQIDVGETFHNALLAASMAVAAMVAQWNELPFSYMWIWTAVVFCAANAIRTARFPAANPLRQSLRLASVSVLTLALVQFGLFWKTPYQASFAEIANEIRHYQAAGIPVAQFTHCHGQFHFLGRLEQPLTPLEDQDDLTRWAKQHPAGIFIVQPRANDFLGLSAVETASVYVDFRSRHVMAIRAEDWRAWQLTQAKSTSPVNIVEQSNRIRSEQHR
ncbi:MAG: glycosyltransferase family 39 protein [Planctomycetales bacterium]|nr:glycosyltransferase family 39 protein [Planctomycetales bacterium]